MQERIEVAKYCSHEQIIMFTHMLQRTLDIAVGRKEGRPNMSRHAAAAGTRFRSVCSPFLPRLRGFLFTTHPTQPLNTGCSTAG